MTPNRFIQEKKGIRFQRYDDVSILLLLLFCRTEIRERERERERACGFGGVFAFGWEKVFFAEFGTCEIGFLS
jgi:hypothetical protein